MIKDFGLEGKTALIVGGGRGIGRALAVTMAEAGADVAVASRTASQVEETIEGINQHGRRSLGLSIDITEVDQIEDMVAKTTKELGRIDILVNCAGAVAHGTVVPLPDHPEKPQLTQEAWDLVFATNLTGTYNTCRAVVPQMIERRSGKIINISSASAVVARPYGPAYGVSKAAVNMLTKCFASEWAQYNITVNAVGPGWFWTEMTTKGFEDPETHEERLKEIPLGRLCDHREIGLLGVYLASPASDWMTGQVLYFDGGETAQFV